MDNSLLFQLFFLAIYQKFIEKLIEIYIHTQTLCSELNNVLHNTRIFLSEFEKEYTKRGVVKKTF